MLSLTDQISDSGAGLPPLYEMPTRPEASTPEHLEHQYAAPRARLLREIGHLFKENEENVKGFCIDPATIVRLSVPVEDQEKLFKPQNSISYALIPLVQKVITRWWTEGKIELSAGNHGFNNPLLVAPKKDELGNMTAIRVCIDPRMYNTYQDLRDKFVMPKINDLLARFGGKPIYGQMDLSEAYLQFMIHPDDRKFMAFMWDNKQYQFIGCPYGVTHIPSLFQRYMTNVFVDMPFVFIYIDNIMFASASWEEHQEHIRMIVTRLNSVNLRLKPSATQVGQAQLAILGHIINRFGVGMDPKKVECILNWERPSSGPQLRSYMGLLCFLRGHIRHYAELTAPLEALKMEKGLITWTKMAVQHFELTKLAVARAPWLVHADLNKPFVVILDASQTGVGALLYQPDDDAYTITPYNIVAVCSCKLNETQRRYATYKKELFAMIYAFLKFHSYISLRKFIVITDHQPLIHLLTQRTISNSLAQWQDIVIAYTFDIIHRAGILNIHADALSRMFVYAYGEDDTTWGVHTNIRFIDMSQKYLTPSDLLITDSINKARVPSKSKLA